MDLTRKLIEYFTKFPGIGQRQSRRFVYFLLSQKPEFIDGLIETLKNLKESAKQCSSCFRFFQDNGELCDICRNKNTDNSILMVVEKDIDFENINKSGTYHGRYFILGGLLPILEKNPTDKIRICELINEVGKQISSGLKEIIIAVSANLEGDNTFQYVKKTLEPLEKKHGIKISGLGRGLSTGLELEYSDAETLGNALKSRT